MLNSIIGASAEILKLGLVPSWVLVKNIESICLVPSWKLTSIYHPFIIHEQMNATFCEKKLSIYYIIDQI
jgi:hypothetical protein